MSSPFTTFEEFSNAEGPIYTFANNPVMSVILLVLSFLITLYFFYASLTMHQPHAKKKSGASAIALLLAAGVTSLLSAFGFQPDSRPEPANQSSARQESPVQPMAIAPLAFLGLTGIRAKKARRRSLSKVRF